MSDETSSVKFVTADRDWTDNPSELLYYRDVHTMDDQLNDATKIAELPRRPGPLSFCSGPEKPITSCRVQQA